MQNNTIDMNSEYSNIETVAIKTIDPNPDYIKPYFSQ